MAPNLDWPVKVKSESGIFKRVVTWFPFHRQKGWVNNRSVGNQKIITQTLHKSVQKIITTPKSVSNSWQAKMTWVIPPVATRLLRFTRPSATHAGGVQPTPLITQSQTTGGEWKWSAVSEGVRTHADTNCCFTARRPNQPHPNLG